MDKIMNWIDARFPLTALWESQWGKYVAPKNFNFWYYFGSLAALAGQDGRLRDPQSDNPEQQPDYAKNQTRSIKPEILVLVGTCTHLGCSPTFRPELEPQPFDADWKGGFYCPCHQSKFDLAGRVYKGVPAPTNLVIPPHKYATDTKIVIGQGQDGKDS